jgi:hypothetical protein
MSDDGVCDFSIDGDYDGDTPSFFVEKIVAARKSHACNECGSVIAPREKYRRVSGKWDDEVRSYCFCLPCEETAGEFFESNSSRTFGTLWEEIENNWDHGAHLQACLNRLTTVAAKEHMRRRWMQWKGLA